MNRSDIPNILRDSFEQTPEVLGGKLCVRGTRISVEQVLELLEAGVAPATSSRPFPLSASRPLSDWPPTALWRCCKARCAFCSMRMSQSTFCRCYGPPISKWSPSTSLAAAHYSYLRNRFARNSPAARSELCGGIFSRLAAGLQFARGQSHPIDELS